MSVFISMLRGVNVGGHNKIKMDALKKLYESLGYSDVQTYIQSGNVVFKTKEKSPAKIEKRIEDEIERVFGFRPSVMVRTPAEMREVISRNPFEGRNGLDHAKLAVNFISTDPGGDTREKVRALRGPDGEELFIDGRELYMYFPNGMGRSKLPVMIGKAMKTPCTGRNWNSVLKLLEIAEKLEG